MTFATFSAKMYTTYRITKSKINYSNNNSNVHMSYNYNNVQKKENTKYML